MTLQLFGLSDLFDLKWNGYKTISKSCLHKVGEVEYPKAVVILSG